MAAKTARVLLAMVVPGQIIFMLAIKHLQPSQSVNVDLIFSVVYLTAAFVQVSHLLLPGFPHLLESPGARFTKYLRINSKFSVRFS